MARILPNSTVGGEKIATEIYVDGKINPHINDKNNPHNVTKAQVGLSDVANYTVSTQNQAESGTSNNSYMTPLKTKQAFDKFIEPFNNRLLELENNTAEAMSDLSGLSREVAYLKLKQQASERIEGGVVFGDGFDGTRFGLTLSLDRSENISIGGGKLLAKGQGTEVQNIDSAFITDGVRVQGNSNSRKFIKNNRGRYFYACLNATSTYIEIYKSDDYGKTWTIFASSPKGGGNTDFSIAANSKGDYLYLAHFTHGNSLRFITYNALNDTGSNLGGGVTIASSLNDVRSVAISVSPTDVVDIIYTAKDNTYSQSFNAYHAYSSTPLTSFSSVTRLTTENSNLVNLYYPSVVYLGDVPFLTAVTRNSSSGLNVMRSYISSTRTDFTTYTLATGDYNINSNSFITTKGNVVKFAFIRMNVSGHYDLIYGEANSFAGAPTLKTVISGDANNTLSGSVSVNLDKDDNLYVVYYGRYNGVTGIHFTKETNGNFSPSQLMTTTSTDATTIYMSESDLEITIPPTIVTGSSVRNYLISKINVEVITDTNTAKLVYGIGETNFIGGFFRLHGTISAVVKLEFDDRIETLDLEPSGNPNEFKFTHNIPDSKGFYLIFELTRPNVTGGDSDYMDRLLGGIG